MGKGRVLVIDDEPIVRQMVSMSLAKAGYEVIVAEDGEKGIAALSAGDNPQKVELIICDIYMPNIDGRVAIAHFRAQFPSIPVIVITGKPDLSNAYEFFKQGVVEYLLKPFGTQELIAAVDEALKPKS